MLTGQSWRNNLLMFTIAGIVAADIDPVSKAFKDTFISQLPYLIIRFVVGIRTSGNSAR